jgi:hypothetical protein
MAKKKKTRKAAPKKAAKKKKIAKKKAAPVKKGASGKKAPVKKKAAPKKKASVKKKAAPKKRTALRPPTFQPICVEENNRRLTGSPLLDEDEAWRIANAHAASCNPPHAVDVIER